MKKKGLGGLIVLVALVGCYQDSENIDITYVPDPPREEVEAQATFLTQNVQGQPIEGVQLSLNDQHTQTVSQGFAGLGVERITLDHTVVAVHKTGYFHLDYPVHGFAGETHLQCLPLIEIQFVEQGRADQTGHFQYADELQLEVPPQSLLTEEGDPYTDDYAMAGKILSQKEWTSFSQHRLPLLTTLENSERNLIDVHQAIVIDIFTPDHSKLNVSGQLLVKIQQSGDNQDGHWYLQNQEGNFERIDQVTQEGAFWQLRLDKTGLLVCGTPERAQLVRQQVQNTYGAPLSHVHITLTEDLRGHQHDLFLSDQGHWRWWLSEQSYQMEVHSLCGYELAKVNVARESPSVQLNIEDGEYFQYDGRLVDCDGRVIQDGYLHGVGTHGTWIHPVHYDGTFNALIPYCLSEKIQLIYVDNQGNAKVKNLVIDLSLSDYARDISICNDHNYSESNIYLSNGQSYYFPNCDWECRKENGVWVAFQFTNIGDAFDEVHEFTLTDSGPSGFWKSSSNIGNGDFSIVNIPNAPVIRELELKQRAYYEIILTNVLVRYNQRNGDERATFYYLVPKK